MQARDYWKLGGAAALIGCIGIGFVPRDPTVTVREAVAGPAARAVVLEGEIEVLRPNRFILRDETGEIRLETCPPWYRLLPLRPGERISTLGELAPRSRWLLDRPSFVVHRLRRQDGSEIALRFGEGIPPWRYETWRTTSVTSNE
jgi:hypothetical protein